MSQRSVALVNANEMKPPVAPIGLDYIGGRLASDGIPVELIDVSFAESTVDRIVRGLAEVDPLVVGVTFRNTDDCFWPSCAWFVPRLAQIVETIRSCTTAPIVLGGCGFSIFPRQVMDHCGVDLGIVGDGEEAMSLLARRLAAGTDVNDVPGLARRTDDGRIVVNPPRYDRSLDLPTGRDLIDNARYLRTGAMGNLETKRGCPNACIYCADPLAKGRAARCRDPRQVADEVEALLAQGVDVLHLCDAEFNIPPDHALAVCEAIIARGLGDRVRWYCYATVRGFSAELADAMRRAGCVGVNFGVDTGCDRMLAALGRNYRRDAIRDAVGFCRRTGVAVMLDLLIGGPGEDPDSVSESIEFIKSVDPDRAGAPTGVRLYPGTPMADSVAAQGPMADNPNLHGQVEDNADLFRPVFYIDRQLGDDAPGLVRDLIGEDDRFFKPAPSQDMVDYNYNDNTELEDAIAAGHRGAFWDILRRIA